MIRVSQLPADGKVILKFFGGLDIRSADELVSIALQQPEKMHLIIDVSSALNIHDSALGRLLDLLPRGRSCSISGLKGPQARLLAALDEPRSMPMRRR